MWKFVDKAAKLMYTGIYRLGDYLTYTKHAGFLMSAFFSEILQQPNALRELAYQYQRSMLDMIDRIPLPGQLIITGMGASYYAAQVAAFHLQSFGLQALALEAADLIHYGSPFLNSCKQLVYVSQSGSSAEVKPILDVLHGENAFIAVTNHLNSPLAKKAHYSLPLLVDQEALVATKTYINSLAALWLLARRWHGYGNQGDFENILQISYAIEHILENRDEITTHWLQLYDHCKAFIFTGFGPHAATARQSAQTVAEWAKAPVMGISAGALRHGFLEIVEPGVTVILFTAPGRTEEHSYRLAEELESYGAQLLMVENGYSHAISERRREFTKFDEFLSPMLDIVPAQLFAEALATQQIEKPGFRYLQKVVTKL